MARGNKALVPGMFTVGEMPIPDAIAVLKEEMAAKQSLEWLRSIRDNLSRSYSGLIEDADDALTYTAKEVYQGACVILAPEFSERSHLDQLRTLFILGRRVERLFLMMEFDGKVAMARKVSKANSEKAAKTAKLSDQQWTAIKKSIEQRADGVSVRGCCESISKQLKTGTFRKLSGVRVEITGGALNKRFTKRV